MDKPVNDAPSAVSKSIQKISGPCTFNMGNIYRERAAMIAHKLALEREQQGATAFTGKAPGEHGDRNTGPLTLPGKYLDVIVTDDRVYFSHTGELSRLGPYGEKE